MKRVRIAGLGSYLPTRRVTNAEIASRLSSTPEWIFAHTGIESRRVAGASESAATMGTEAGRAALASAGARPDEIGMVILATTTPDYGSYPSTACLVQSALGCEKAAAFDLSAACSGFVYGLEMAKCWLRCNPEKKALVIGSEVLSRHIDWTDRSSAMLFGDGAGAAVLEAAEWNEACFGTTILGADGKGAQAIFREAGSRKPLNDDPVHETTGTMAVPYLKMDGHAVFAFAVRKLEEVIRNLCEQSGVTVDSLVRIFAHQANYRILDSVARRMQLPIEKFYLNLKDVGNTSSASIPLCLDGAIRSGELENGMTIALAGFGSGLTWAGMLLQWPYLA